jgi:integrase
LGEEQKQERENQKMSKAKLPRGVRARGGSLYAVFALADGTIERRSVGSVSIPYAKEQLAIYKRQVREGTYEKRQPRQPKQAAPTVGDLFAEYLRSYKLKGQKAAWRQTCAWAHLESTFAKLEPSEISTAMLGRYQETRLAEGAAAATCNRELSALSACLYSAAKTTGAGGRPVLDRVCIFPAKLKESAPRRGFLTDKEYSKLMDAAKLPWLRALVALAYAFGFRKSELLGLGVSQVNLLDGWLALHGEDTKNGEGRKVKLTQECIRLLVPCCACKQETAFVFTRSDGTPIVDFRDDWHALCTAAGLPSLLLHDFRRSAVRNMMRSGVSQTVAMKVSGHRTASVFRRYDICDEADLIGATQKIEASREVSAAETTDTKTSTMAFSGSALPS